MIEPAVIEPIIQKAGGDCAVAGLAMMLGLPYATVFAAIPKRTHVKREGLNERQIVNVGKRLGVRIAYRHTPPEDDEFGLLHLCNAKDGHTALHLKGGYVYDPADGLIYTDIGAFMTAKEWTTIQTFYWRKS